MPRRLGIKGGFRVDSSRHRHLDEQARRLGFADLRSCLQVLLDDGWRIPKLASHLATTQPAIRRATTDHHLHQPPCRQQLADRDTKFTAAFDAVFAAVGIEVLVTPVWAPQANAYAERWVGTVHRECLDRMLVVGRRQLVSVLRESAEDYNGHRPASRVGAGTAAWLWPTGGLPAGWESGAAGSIRRAGP